MRHFETERENFSRDGFPIKTLALFFIDSIESYRGLEGNNDGWLRQKFLDSAISSQEQACVLDSDCSVISQDS